jgi:HSP20 family protein
MSQRTISKKKGNKNSSTQLATTQEQGSLSTGFDDIFDQFRRSFDDLVAPYYPFSRIGISTPLSQLPIRSSVVDFIDEGDHYLISAELPGFTKDQVDVKISKDGLVIRAEQQQTHNEQKNGKTYLHRERAYSAFERVIEFPEEVMPQKVEGTMKDGVLQLIVPKKEPAPEERLTKVQLR